MTTDLNRDPAEPVVPEVKTPTDDDGTSGGIDWESTDNPYKKKFSGEQSRSSRLETDRDEARTTLSNLDRVVKRLDNIEDELADIGDRPAVPASSSNADPFNDDLDDDPPAATTGRRREKLQESRQTELKEGTDATARKVYAIFQQEFADGMDNQSPEMLEVQKLYNSALEDPALRGNLNTALVMFRSYKRSVESAAPPPSPPPTPSGEGDGDIDGEGSADSDNSATDAASAKDDEPTARQKNRDAGADQGQQGAGGAVPRDTSNLKPVEKFALHHEGKTPQDY